MFGDIALYDLSYGLVSDLKANVKSYLYFKKIEIFCNNKEFRIGPRL